MEITHNSRFDKGWCHSDVETRWICVPNVVEDRHDQSSRKIPLLSVPLSVFFYQQIFGSWGTLLSAKNNHSRDTRFILVQAPEK